MRFFKHVPVAECVSEHAPTCLTVTKVIGTFKKKKGFSTRSAPMLKITQSSTRRYTPHILSSCRGDASGNFTTGEWMMTPVSQRVGTRSERGEITARLSQGSLLRSPTRAPMCRQWRELLCAQQGLLLGHQRAPAVRDDRHGLRDDSKLPLPCQQVSLRAPFIFYCTCSLQVVRLAHSESVAHFGYGALWVGGI